MISITVIVTSIVIISSSSSCSSIVVRISMVIQNENIDTCMLYIYVYMCILPIAIC